MAETGEGACGFAGFGPATGEPGVAMVYTCYLLPEVWRHGYGTRLMAAVVDVLAGAAYREATLWVLEGNDRGRRFYEATGWYADGAPAPRNAGASTVRTVRYRRAI